MKNIRFFIFVLTLATLVLSACGAVTATPTAAPQVDQSTNVAAMPISFVGIVDSIAGDQWVISGTNVTVDASIVRNGPFNVGDQVKVEGFVNPDGSFTLSRVETPAPQETATLPPFADDNSNDALINGNTNDASTNVNDDNSNSANINDDNSNSANSNDDNSNSANINDDNSNSTTSNDNSSSANTNDDNGGSNSNDSHGNDNSSGGGNDNSSGGNSNDG
jgi:hypothetical protein